MINIGALIIRIGFWEALYYDYNKEPPKTVQAIIEAPIVLRWLVLFAEIPERPAYEPSHGGFRKLGVPYVGSL